MPRGVYRRTIEHSLCIKAGMAKVDCSRSPETRAKISRARVKKVEMVKQESCYISDNSVTKNGKEVSDANAADELKGERG